MEAVVLEKSQTGLGFSIAGGSDRDEHFIRVSGINEGGAVARDGRIKFVSILLLPVKRQMINFTTLEQEM